MEKKTVRRLTPSHRANFLWYLSYFPRALNSIKFWAITSGPEFLFLCFLPIPAGVGPWGPPKADQLWVSFWLVVAPPRICEIRLFSKYLFQAEWGVLANTKSRERR